MCCECQFSMKESEIVEQLLKNDSIDHSSSSRKFSWMSTDDGASYNQDSQFRMQKQNARINPSRNPNNVNRSYFGYRTNHKMNNYQFKFMENVERYMEHYRMEHKSFNCLSSSSETKEYDRFVYREPISEFVKQKETKENQPAEHQLTNPNRKLDIKQSEKSLEQQVKFWKNQNQNNSNSNVNNSTFSIENIDSRNLDGLQGVNAHWLNNGSSNKSMTGNRSIQTRRMLDVYIPQGSTYDLLTEENRINKGLLHESNDNMKTPLYYSTNENDYVPVSGPINSCLKISREPTTINQTYNQSKPPVPISIIRRYTHNGSSTNKNHVVGGTLEFAKLLDEKLYMLQQQKGTNQNNPQLTNQRSISNLVGTNRNRPHSASNSNHEGALSGLSINGRTFSKTVWDKNCGNSNKEINNKTNTNAVDHSGQEQNDNSFRIDITGRCFYSVKNNHESFTDTLNK